mgnify:CR=1 FL=1
MERVDGVQDRVAVDAREVRLPIGHPRARIGHTEARLAHIPIERHALENGLRIIMVDFFPEGVKDQRPLFWGVVFLTFAAGIPGSLVILWPFIDGQIL